MSSHEDLSVLADKLVLLLSRQINAWSRLAITERHVDCVSMDLVVDGALVRRLVEVFPMTTASPSTQKLTLSCTLTRVDYSEEPST